MKIAIVGAAGAVGREFLRVLDEQDFPVDELLLFGSSHSAGTEITFREKVHVIKELRHDTDDFKDVDFAFVSAGADVSINFAKDITRYGAVMIDNSSAFRLEPDVPLVVPEVNGLDALTAPRGIIANPNCTTIQMCVTLKPLHDIANIRRVHVATYQAASGAGAAGMDELSAQHNAIAAGKEPHVEHFAYQLAYNLIPHIDVFDPNGYTKEEMKMHLETKRIMHDSEMLVSATCVRVPVMRAHSEAIWIETERPLTVAEAHEAFSHAPGVVLLDNPSARLYPMPLEVAHRDPVYVGRVRLDLANPNGLSYWCVGDQIKKGAALNAVQIARTILNNK